MTLIKSDKDKIVFPELSYQIIGAAFNVFNELGWGFSEKDYQSALAKEFEGKSIKFKREVYIPINYKDSLIKKYYADFVVDEKILVELKVVPRLGYFHLRQLLNYLKLSGLRLGILIYFSREGIKYRRVLNGV